MTIIIITIINSIAGPMAQSTPIEQIIVIMTIIIITIINSIA